MRDMHLWSLGHLSEIWQTLRPKKLPRLSWIRGHYRQHGNSATQCKCAPSHRGLRPSPTISAHHGGDISWLLYATPPSVEVARRSPGGGGGALGGGGEASRRGGLL